MSEIMGHSEKKTVHECNIIDTILGNVRILSKKLHYLAPATAD